MTPASKVALEKVRTAFHEAVQKLPPDQYKEVIEEFQTDLEGKLEALAEESKD